MEISPLTEKKKKGKKTVEGFSLFVRLTPNAKQRH